MKNIKIFFISLFGILLLSSCGKEYTPDYCFEVNGNEITKFKWWDNKCTNSVIIPEKINDRKILSIKNWVFKWDCGCNHPEWWSKDCDYSKMIYGTVDIPDTVEEIWEDAFMCNDIIELKLWKWVISIGKYAFDRNPHLYKVEIISDIKIDKNVKIFDPKTEVIYK